MGRGEGWSPKGVSIRQLACFAGPSPSILSGAVANCHAQEQGKMGNRGVYLLVCCAMSIVYSLVCDGFKLEAQDTWELCRSIILLAI
jgi:hypothetical protein